MEASQSADGEEKGGKWERNPTNERGRKGTRIASLKSSLLAINWRCRCDRLWRDLIGLFAGRRSKMLRSLLALKKKKKKKKKKKSSALVKQRMHGVAIEKRKKEERKKRKIDGSTKRCFAGLAFDGLSLMEALNGVEERKVWRGSVDEYLTTLVATPFRR